MGKPRRQPVKIDTTVGDAISTAFGVISELAEEMRKVCDNTPENLQGSNLYALREEAADALESISEPEPPDALRDLPVSFSALPLPRRASRADRLSDGLLYAQEAIDALTVHMESQDSDAAQEGDDDPSDLISEIQDLIDSAEAVEFPGMYG